jgi:CysZ protein
MALHWEGLRTLTRERSLWLPAAVPFALGMLALGLAALVIASHAGELWGWTAGWLPWLAAGPWYAWLWVGPARAALAAVGALLFAAACGAILAAAWILAGALGAPFLDALSRRVEVLATGGVRDGSDGGVRGLAGEALRAVALELRRGIFFAAVQAGLFLAGVVLPGGALLAPPGMLLFAMLFLPLDYAGYTHDRRRVPFRARRRWILAHRARMLGFGGAAFATLLVPGLNFLAMPGLVVSGTLLALRTPIPEPEREPEPPGPRELLDPDAPQAPRP